MVYWFAIVLLGIHVFEVTQFYIKYRYSITIGTLDSCTWAKTIPTYTAVIEHNRKIEPEKNVCIATSRIEERIDGNNTTTVFTADFLPPGKIKRQTPYHSFSPVSWTVYVKTNHRYLHRVFVQGRERGFRRLTKAKDNLTLSLSCSHKNQREKFQKKYSHMSTFSMLICVLRNCEGIPFFSNHSAINVFFEALENKIILTILKIKFVSRSWNAAVILNLAGPFKTSSRCYISYTSTTRIGSSSILYTNFKNKRKNSNKELHISCDVLTKKSIISFVTHQFSLSAVNSIYLH
ncbi:hypothetical protein AGLY_007768 [Aphis glycines]|uniref:Uncharacterized protein n=1 Tax=Aphis glycines TaxID=307491 RepID=A0A6G0TNI2_APHGL|nr:hypothetical protein AGLY_007768 [Aphis glycines]